VSVLSIYQFIRQIKDQIFFESLTKIEYEERVGFDELYYTNQMNIHLHILFSYRNDH
jgi:hypothetical protein